MQQRTRRGPDCLKLLPELVCAAEARSVLVVHGRESYRRSGAAKVVEGLGAEDVRHFDAVKANPDLYSIAAAGRLYREADPAVVIAVGGGSVIDTAKAMMAVAVQPDLDELTASRFALGPDRPLFVAVPTTAGSGSEATHFAVVYRGTEKYSLAHPALRPDAVFLDPKLVLSCPRELSAAAGADALCQSVESWWSRGCSSESRAYAERALERIGSAFLASLDDGSRIELRGRMLDAANLAGEAINLTKTTAGHAMSYGLTGRFGLPHGLAVLAVMQYLVKDMALRGEIPDSLDRAAGLLGPATSFPEVFDSLAEAVWSRTPLTCYFDEVDGAGGEPDTVIDALVGGVNVERLSNHPAALSEPRIGSVYRAVIQRHS